MFSKMLAKMFMQISSRSTYGLEILVLDHPQGPNVPRTLENTHKVGTSRDTDGSDSGFFGVAAGAETPGQLYPELPVGCRKVAADCQQPAGRSLPAACRACLALRNEGPGWPKKQ